MTITLTDAEYETLKLGLTAANCFYETQKLRLHSGEIEKAEFDKIEKWRNELWKVADKIKTGGLFS